MATAIPLPTGENATFILSRRTELGPFERASADRLVNRAPICRSDLISARLQLEEPELPVKHSQLWAFRRSY